jgi:26S proteasome regulatory subunit N7
MGSDPQYVKHPDLSLGQQIFTLTNPYSTGQQSALKKLQDAIKEHKMAPLYRYLAHPTEGILNPSGQGSSSKPSSDATQTSGPKMTGGALPTSVELPWDESSYDSMVEENQKELEAIQKEEEDASDNAGDTEVQAAKGKRAEFWARVGDKVSNMSLR